MHESGRLTTTAALIRLQVNPRIEPLSGLPGSLGLASEYERRQNKVRSVLMGVVLLVPFRAHASLLA